MTHSKRFSIAIVFTCLLLLLVHTLAAQAPQPATGAAFQNPVKKALKEGKVVLGVTITTPSTEVVASLANSGFDFLWIEMEHSPVTLESVRQMILVTRGLKAVPFTRVPVNQPWLAKRVLDSGSIGVIFPFTSTRELAMQAVAACRYPPAGVRGFGPGLAASRWGMSGNEYARWANENVVVIPIIEQKQAIENIDEIASVPGIDVLFIGVNDLSYSLGVGGQLDHPLVKEAIARVAAAGKKHNVPLGYPTASPKQIKELVAQGFRLFQASSDIGLMQVGARQLLSGTGEAIPGQRASGIY